ncbi:Gfo/Idh/MocA family protein [Leifsonia sp. A12D58]|uniref:Gfo/Idh/MocA family protein n=1 Tax=Leifsonia sp. A12D58 TaxID=3397674 RepID=UPI0039E08675
MSDQDLTVNDDVERLNSDAPAAPAVVPVGSEPNGTERPRRVAVIGCGDISAVHFAVIAGLPGVQLVGVSDSDAGRLSSAVNTHAVPGFADHLALFEELKPDVVHICTPHNTHAQLAIDALDRGINVIVEKPLAHSREEGERVAAAAAQSSAQIAVCFQNRYNAPIAAAHELLTGGTLGAILGASATVNWHRTAEYYLNRPWRGRWATGGGGLLMNQAIHTIDLLQWLIGPVASVSGNASTRVLGDVIEVEDTAELVIDHVNGARSVFYATLANVVNSPVTLDIVTENALLSIRGDLTVAYTDPLADGRVDVITESHRATGERAYWGVSHERLITDFYSRLDSGEPFWIDPIEAQKSLNIIQDVYDQSYPERANDHIHPTTTERVIS